MSTLHRVNAAGAAGVRSLGPSPRPPDYQTNRIWLPRLSLPSPAQPLICPLASSPAAHLTAAPVALLSLSNRFM